MALPVEFADASECHMVEIEIKAHADGVGCHQEVDVAVLVKRDLRVASAGRQRPEHHGGTAALAPD